MSRTSADISPPRLFGRESEAETLRDALDRARTGNPQVVVLEGESGSGKTFLLHTLLDHGNHALCWANTSEFANAEFGPVKDTLRRFRREAPARFDALRRDYPVVALLLPEPGNEASPVASRDALRAAALQAAGEHLGMGG